MVSSGLKDAGYVYINIDDTWQGQRDAQGVIHPNDRASLKLGGYPAETKSGHVNHSTFRRPNRAALKLCKVRPFVLYSLRHTFLTWLGAGGCDVWTLMKIAVHSNMQQSMAYIHPDSKTVQAAVEKAAMRRVGTKLGTIQKQPFPRKSWKRLQVIQN